MYIKIGKVKVSKIENEGKDRWRKEINREENKEKVLKIEKGKKIKREDNEDKINEDKDRESKENYK